jgi:arsenate reductase
MPDSVAASTDFGNERGNAPTNRLAGGTSARTESLSAIRRPHFRHARARVHDGTKETPDRRGILFLCVANSARSQLAEGIANRLAPPDVEIYSAGASPARISSYAIRVLAEIGIDASGQYSKPIEAIPLERVGTVITLCAEEVCPTVPVRVQRLHWPLPDPSGAGVLENDVLSGYRRVRDELVSRLTAYFKTEVAAAD